MDDTDDLVTKRAEVRIGTILKDKWRLDKLLGVGGMASVYAATHRNSKRVAVKMLHPEISMDAAMRQRFLREGYVANKVGHRGAVAVDDDDTTEDGAAFLVMELLEGETLDARMRRKGGKLSQAEVLSAMDQVLDTLAAAHDQGIVHRDLKPENIFMTKDGVMKILDFGIARMREMSGKSSATQTGSLMGTPAFMPPEQARGRWEEVDARSDLWAVGATMFSLLTGRFVHEAETANEALVLAVTARAPSLATIDPVIVPAVVELIDKSLTYEKEGRFQTAREMQAAGRAAYAEVEGSARMPQLSVPDAAPSEEAPVIVPEAKAKSATPTTGRAVTSPVVDSEPSTKREASRKSPVLPAAAIGAVLLLAGGAVLLSKGRSEPSSEPPAAATPQKPVAAPESPTVPTGPAVAPVANPTSDKNAVSVDSLPIEKAASDDPKRRPKEGVGAPAASGAPPSEQPAAAKPAAPAPAPAPAAPPPAWLRSAVTAPSAAPAASPPPAKKASGSDLFQKRF